MTYNEETNLLNNIEDIKEVIRSPTFKQLLKETHENNIMLKEIIRFINTYLSNHNNENDNDFFRNVLANLISNGINIKR
jgi:hypothetical protein